VPVVLREGADHEAVDGLPRLRAPDAAAWVSDDDAFAAGVEDRAGERLPVLAPGRLADELDARMLNPAPQAHHAVMRERSPGTVEGGVEVEPRDALVVAVGARPVGAGLDLSDQRQPRELAGELLADPPHGHPKVEPRTRGHVLDARVGAEAHRAPAAVDLLLEDRPRLAPRRDGLDHAVDRSVRERERHLPILPGDHELGQVRAPGGQVVGGGACVHALIMGSATRNVNGFVIMHPASQKAQ
jgi:hypothetical protein